MGSIPRSPVFRPTSQNKIGNDLLPEFGHRLLVDIRRRDVRDHVESIARKRDAPIMANRTLAVLSCMFNYALDREWVEFNPAARIASPGEERSRDRVLSDDELRELWTALQTLADQTVGGQFQARSPRTRVRILCRGLSLEFGAHDLRRTAATRMAEAGVPREHIDKVLNHVEGGPAATRVYNRYAYDAEKREALERWARRLQAILEGQTQKVVPIRA